MIKRDNLVTTERIEAFSDGVIAIIITLMILEIKLPQFDPGTLSGKELKHVIMPVLPKLIAYALSFFTLGIYWINHHHFFKKVNFSDRGLIWLNLNLLFWMSLVPLPTAFMGQHYEMPLASLFYGGVMFMNSLSFTLMGIYAQSREGLFSELVPPQIRRKNMRRNLTTLGIYLLAMVICYVSVALSMALFLFVSVWHALPRLGFQPTSTAKKS